MDRLKCLVHRITLQQLLGQDFLQPLQPASGHLHALLEQPPDHAITAESLADRILEWAADRQPPQQPPAALPQPQDPPSPNALAGSACGTSLERPSRAASLAGAGSGAEEEDVLRSEAGGRRAEAHGHGRGTWREGDDSGAASVSGSEGVGASSLGSPGNDTPPDSCQKSPAGTDHRTQEGLSVEQQPRRSALGEEREASPEAGAAAEKPRAADVGHLTPTAMHAGLRVAEARAKAARLGAQLDRVLAVRAGGGPVGSVPTI